VENGYSAWRDTKREDSLGNIIDVVSAMQHSPKESRPVIDDIWQHECQFSRNGI
jgi:hypothetical protein